MSGRAAATLDLRGRRILVTGARGFTGRRVCDALLSRGARVVALARQEIEARPDLHPVVCDLRDTPELPGPFDAVVHCAATSPGPGVTDGMIHRDSVEGSLKLLEQVDDAGCGRIIFLSSLSVHGDIREAVVTPDTPTIDPDAYGRSKLAVENILKTLSTTIPSVAIRLPGIVGPGAQRNWLTRVKAAALRDEDITIFNPDAPYNNLIHVDDLVKFVLQLCGRRFKGFQAFPIGAGGSISVRTAVETLIEHADSRSMVRVADTERHSFLLSNEAAKALGYQPADVADVIAKYAIESELK